ncbi:hypothetical protein [Oceanobacillus jeddahense]|uniref:hypothetical protein n=1 Tax=Oceanobacillus jeddahense TaxID=1462527 RepID=UPI000595F908|nr:hypothetical protein [Oceanobacillus jeddahense]
MQKIKLTPEQWEAIEIRNSPDQRALVVEHHVKKRWTNLINECLNELSTEELCRVLYEPNSYEVMPEFKEGDWVINYRGDIGKIESVSDNCIYAGKWYESPGSESLMYCRQDVFDHHANEEEKKKGFWWSIGREVDEYRMDDFVFVESMGYGFIRSGLNFMDDYRVVEFIENGEIKGCHVHLLRLITKTDERLDK